MQVYRTPFELAESVATFLATGLEAGEAAVVVATAAHRPLFADRLARAGWPAERLEAERRLVLADADETLAAILEDGMPSPRRFARVVGGLVDGAAAGSDGGRVRIFGEMVDVLCRRGEAAAADALEALWNRLGAEKAFSLLCGYRVDLFDREAQVSLLPQVYRSHAHVVGGVDADSLERAVDLALTEVLGPEDAQKVYAQAARQAGPQQIPLAQVVLMWVSAHMPRTAERVLASARAHYPGAAA